MRFDYQTTGTTDAHRGRRRRAIAAILALIMVLLTVAMTAPHHHRMACSVQDGPTLAAFTPAAATCALCEFCVPPILPAAAITLILALLVSIATVLSVRRAALCARPLPRGLLRAPPISSFCTVA